MNAHSPIGSRLVSRDSSLNSERTSRVLAFGLALLLVAAALTSCSPRGSAPGFEVEGVVRTGGGPINAFRVFARETQWLICFAPTASFTNAPFYWEVGSTNNAELIVATVHPVQQQVSAVIESNSVPKAVPPAVAQLWLAYCSTWYLDHHAPEELPPVYAFNPMERRMSAGEVRCQRDAQPPHLPKEVTFQSASHAGFAESQQSVLEARYQVEAVTNAGGWSIPTHMVLEQYARKPGVEFETNSMVLQRTEVVAQVVRDRCRRKNLLPDMASHTYALDRRLADPTAGRSELWYRIPTNHWPTVAESRDLYEKQQIRQHPELGFAIPLPKAPPLRKPTTVRDVILWGAGLTLAGLAVFKIFDKVRVSRQAKEQRRRKHYARFET
jgi:hypothetical protein